MFHWFQRLMPKEDRFFGLFARHAETLVAGSDSLVKLFAGGDTIPLYCQAISDHEHVADDVIREVLVLVRRTFITPFDRSAITSLISSMDDAIDEMQAAVQAIDLYEVSTFEQEMKDLGAIIVDAARLTAEAMPLMRDVGRNGGRLHELTERLVRMEGHADEIYRAGVKRAFKEKGHTDTLGFSVDREIYKHLERIVDAFEDVANEIDSIVIDHS